MYTLHLGPCEDPFDFEDEPALHLYLQIGLNTSQDMPDQSPIQINADQ